MDDLPADVQAQIRKQWAAEDAQARVSARAPEGKPARPPAYRKGEPNKTEAAYARRLELLKIDGRILWYGFECVKLPLAKRTTYTPDFLVVNADCSLSFHEVKGGFIRPDAMLKLKLAVEKYRMVTFFLCQYTKGQWSTREMKP